MCKSDLYPLYAFSSWYVFHCLHLSHTAFCFSLLLFPLESSYSNYYFDGDREGNNQDDDSYYGKSVCAVADGGESDQWYLGQTQCFKANSAFSLYGILKDSSAEQKQGSYCHKGTFINSFFTTAGVETIAQTFGLGSYLQADDDGGNDGFVAPSYPSSYCEWITYYSDDDGGDQQGGGEDQYLSKYTDATSYGTGCLNKQFVLDQYAGALCNPARYNQTLDTFDSFNGDLESMGCFQIFDGSNYQEEGEGRRKLEDEEDFDLLSNSRACSVQLYPNECPDPYGLVKKYEQSLNNALTTKTVSRTGSHTAAMVTTLSSWMFLFVGAVLMVASFCVRKNKAERTIQSEPDDYDIKSPSHSVVRSVSTPAPSLVQSVSSTISERARSMKEAIQNYAEEEEDIDATADVILPPYVSRSEQPEFVSPLRSPDPQTPMAQPEPPAPPTQSSILHPPDQSNNPSPPQSVHSATPQPSVHSKDPSLETPQNPSPQPSVHSKEPSLETPQNPSPRSSVPPKERSLESPQNPSPQPSVPSITLSFTPSQNPTPQPPDNSEAAPLQQTDPVSASLPVPAPVDTSTATPSLPPAYSNVATPTRKKKRPRLAKLSRKILGLRKKAP